MKETQLICTNTKARYEWGARLYRTCRDTELCISSQNCPTCVLQPDLPNTQWTASTPKQLFTSPQVQGSFCLKESSDGNVTCWHTKEHLLGEGFLPGSFQSFMWEFRLSAMLQHIGDECNKTNWYPQTTHKQQAFSTELVTSYELILYFYSPRPYSMFKVKSFKACALLTSTCCLTFTHGKTTDRTALSEQNRNPDKFSQTKYIEFVLRARVALRIMDQHSHWQVLPLFTTSLQHNHLCIRFLNNKLQQFQKLQKKTYV